MGEGRIHMGFGEGALVVDILRNPAGLGMVSKKEKEKTKRKERETPPWDSGMRRRLPTGIVGAAALHMTEGGIAVEVEGNHHDHSNSPVKEDSTTWLTIRDKRNNTAG